MDEDGGDRRPPRRVVGPAAIALAWTGRIPSASRAAEAAGLWLSRQWTLEVDGRRLFLWLPACMGAGILLYFAATAEPSLWAPLAAAALFTAAAIATRRRAGLAFEVNLALALLFAGFSAAALRTAGMAAPVLDRPRILKLTAVVEAVDIRLGGGRLLLRPLTAEGLGPAALPYRIRVTTPKPPTVKAGDTVAATARLLPPPEPSRPGGYDFAREAWFAGIGAVGSLAGPIELTPAAQEQDWGLRFAAAVDRARNALTRRIADSVGGPSGAVAASLVTGKRGLIPEDTNEDLRAAGIYHVVSISGLHMVLAAGMVFWSLRALFALSPALALRHPIKKWAALAAMGAALAYNIFAGSEIATQRSLLMSLVLLGATLADRPALSMRNLAIAALVVLALEPESLLGPSFQMSFGAVAALIALYERHGPRAPEPESLGLAGLGQPRAAAPALPVGPVLRRVLAARRHVVAVVLTTLVAEAATAPFGLYHFQRFTPYGLVGNALTLPLVSFVAMPAAVLGVIAIPFGLDAPVWQVMGLGVQGMLHVADMVAGWQGSVKTVPAFGPPALGALSLAILCATLWRSGLKLAAVPLAALGIVLAAAQTQPDLVVARDGVVLAVRGPDGRLAVLGRPGSFVLEQWLRADGDLRKVDDPGLFAGSRCDPWGCVARLPDGRAVAQILAPEAFEEDCRRAAVVVTPLAAPAFCKPAVLIDKPVLDGRGAIMLFKAMADLPGAYDIVSQRSPGTDRPWMPRPKSPPPSSKRTDPPEPAADETPRLDPIW
jgi:competence protein ComEC